jgi:hypothetical protein
MSALPGRSADDRGDHPRDAPSGTGPIPGSARGLIAILWRAGLRISEALTSTETDLDSKTGSVLVRRRKRREAKDGGRGRLGVRARRSLDRASRPAADRPAVLHPRGATCGRGWSATAVRGELRRLAAEAGVRRRFAPHQLRHAHAIEMAHEGIPLPILQRQLGNAHSGSRRFTCRESTLARSSTRSTTADRRRTRPALACGHSRNRRRAGDGRITGPSHSAPFSREVTAVTKRHDDPVTRRVRLRQPPKGLSV